jgi:hypothetical protein
MTRPIAPQALSSKPQKTRKDAETGRSTFRAFLRFLRFQISSGSAAMQF